MSDTETPSGTDVTNTSPEETTSSFPAGLVFKKLLNFKKEFIDLTGVSKRGEYWATYVCLALPLALISFLITLILGLIFIAAGGKTCAIVISILVAVIRLGIIAILFPVTVRRTRDCGWPVWVGFGLIMGMAFAELAAVPILSMIVGLAVLVLFITLGCIPSKEPLKGDKNLKQMSLITAGACVGCALLGIVISICSICSDKSMSFSDMANKMRKESNSLFSPSRSASKCINCGCQVDDSDNPFPFCRSCARKAAQAGFEKLQKELENDL